MTESWTLDDGGTSATTNRFVPPFGDPSLELFGHGWTPNNDPPAPVDGYTGRHRAPDVDG